MLVSLYPEKFREFFFYHAVKLSTEEKSLNCNWDYFRLTPVALSIPVSREEGRNVDVYLVRWYKEVNVKASLQSL